MGVVRSCSLSWHTSPRLRNLSLPIHFVATYGWHCNEAAAWIWEPLSETNTDLFSMFWHFKQSILNPSISLLLGLNGKKKKINDQTDKQVIWLHLKLWFPISIELQCHQLILACLFFSHLVFYPLISFLKSPITSPP